MRCHRLIILRNNLLPEIISAYLKLLGKHEIENYKVLC